MPAEHTRVLRVKGDDPENTTIGIVATDAALTKAQAKRLALVAQDGLAMALHPAHAALDGDTIFAAATGTALEPPSMRDLTELGTVAASCIARAIARAIYEATPLPFAGSPPSWRQKFGTR
jgi:L-aminopeptidase/D-esterase-like protein